MQISVTVRPTAAFPEIFGGGTWCAARFWGLGSTTVTVADAEATEIEGLSALRREIDLMVGGDGAGRPGSFRRASPTAVEVVAADGTVIKTLGCLSTQVDPALGASVDPSTRTTIGQATHRALLACPLIVVATVS